VRGLRIAEATQLLLPWEQGCAAGRWEQGCVAGRWEQLPERTRAQVLTLLARMIARGVLVEDGTDG
jgi:hypothetical protein